MKTKITELFNIRYPVLLPGMSLISVPKLVAAVSQAGGLGILASGTMSQKEALAAIHEVQSLTDKPFGFGASLMIPGAKENVALALKEKVPVINFSLGKGDWIVEQAHAYGGKVIATVVNERHALAASRYGVDALLVTGHEAAAHGGDVTSLVLIPRLADIVDMPIVAAGGFGDGRGLMAALALGADGIAMGTRFASTKESPVHDNTKQAILDRSISDTIYTTKFDGMPCRIMETRSAIEYIQETPEDADMFSTALRAGPAIMAAIVEGDLDKGVQLIGQVQGLIEDVPTVEELVQRVISEANSIRSTLPI